MSDEQMSKVFRGRYNRRNFVKFATFASISTSFLLEACGSTSPPTSTTAAVQPKGSPPAFDLACTFDQWGATDKAVAVNKVASKHLRIGVLGLENNPFWIPVKQGTTDANQELSSHNASVEWIVPGQQHTGDVFGPAIETLIARKYDAIVTIAGDAGVAPFINKAANAGIPVATFNSETAVQNKRLFFVGADLYLQGQAAGKAMATVLGGQGKVGIITGFFAVEAHELRRKGFVDYLHKNNPGITIVGQVENHDQADTAFSQAKDFMTAHADLAAIYVTAGGPFGAARAVEQTSKTGKVKIISFDFVDETMQYVKKGVISATIGQDPHAQGHDPAIRLFNFLVTGTYPKCGKYLTESAVVTQQNIDQYWKPTS